jgi:flagellar FliJ protein
MASQSQLDTLIELARIASDEAAKRLGAALRAVQENEEKLQMLNGYRDDYAQRFDAAMAIGMTPMAYRNFQAFLEKLDSAIKGQQEIVLQARQRSERERSSWQDSERKRMSYTTLSNRAQQQAQQLEAKRDQKLMDEHAARQAYYKR